jgi:hypothetical protein
MIEKMLMVLRHIKVRVCLSGSLRFGAQVLGHEAMAPKTMASWLSGSHSYYPETLVIPS